MLLGRLWHRRPPWETVGAAAAVLVFAGVSLSYALSAPLFYHRDEMAHVGYAHAVADGQLPRIDTFSPVPESATIWQEKLRYSPDDRYRQVWVANHPPLNYVAAAPLIWYSNLTDRPDGGLILLRLMNVGFAAVGVALTYLVGYQLSGGRRWIGLVATSMVALSPHPHLWFSQAMNDGLGLAAITFVLWAGLRYLRRGHSAGGLALLSAAVAIASASRAAGLLVAVGIVGVVVAHRLWSRAGPVRERLRAGVLTGAAALGPAAVLVGWFYLRNIVLYGDIGASSFLLDRFMREPAGSILGFAADTLQWEIAFRTIVSQTVTLGPDGHSYSDVGLPARLVMVLAAIGLAWAFLAWLSRLSKDRQGPSHEGPTAGASGRTPPVWPGVLVCGVVIAVVMATYAQHVSGGGLPHYRYLYPALPAVAALVAIGLDRLGPRVLPVLVVAGQGLLLAPLVLPTGRTYRAYVVLMPEGMAKIPEGWSLPHTASVGVALAGGLVLVGVLVGAVAAPLARRLGATVPAEDAALAPATRFARSCSRRRLPGRKRAPVPTGDARGELVRGAGW